MLSPQETEQVRKKLLEQIEKMPKEKVGNIREAVMNASSDELESYVKPQVGCLFCGISQGKISTIKVYEDESIIAFLDINPSAAGQVIVIPKEHHEFLFKVPDQVLWEMMRLVKILSPIIIGATSASGLSFYVAQGNAAGQTIDHLSFNLVPRFEGDKASFGWERKSVDKKELEEAAEKISSGLEAFLKEEKEKTREKIEEEEEKKKEDSKIAKSYGLSRRRL